jgi:hypothetical protein
MLTVVHRPARACEVTIVRAPDDVRAALAFAIAREPCRVSLEVRAIATPGGLYVLARDFDGRVRERVVPDARSAAVLVTSWAADNGFPVQPVQLVATPAPAYDDDEPTVPVHHDGQRRLEVFAMFPLGGRVTADLAAPGRWTAGIGGTAATRTLRHEETLGNGDLILARNVVATDVQAFGYIARSFGEGLWTLRTSIGAGVVRTHISDSSIALDGMPTATPESLTRALPFGDVTITLGRDFATSWGLDVGLAVEIYEQTIYLTNRDSFGTINRSGQPELAIALRRYL